MSSIAVCASRIRVFSIEDKCVLILYFCAHVVLVFASSVSVFASSISVFASCVVPVR